MLFKLVLAHLCWGGTRDKKIFDLKESFNKIQNNNNLKKTNRMQKHSPHCHLVVNVFIGLENPPASTILLFVVAEN